MDRDNVDAISEALSESFAELQNTIEQYATKQLTQYTNEPSTWKEKQLKDQTKFKKAISVLIKQFSHKINKPIESAFSELFKDAKATLEDVKDGKYEPTLKQKKIETFKMKAMIDINNLGKQALIGFKKVVNSVGKEIYQKKIFSADELFNKINEAMKTGISDMTVKTKSGRVMTYKAYMEMNVRTTMHKEALDYQYESAKSFGVVFYLCSSHADCADDHKDYQGRIYYDENWKSIVKKQEIEAVEKAIKSKKCLPLQKCRDGKPYITTRPNCRHTFMPLTLEQVVGNTADQLLDKFKMKKGEYDSKNYKDLQKQRYYERQVRNAKQQRDNLEIELSNAKDQKTRDMLTKQLNAQKSKVRKYQRAVNEVVKSNDVLKRDYRRENYKAIVQDVGVKYNKDKK